MSALLRKIFSAAVVASSIVPFSLAFAQSTDFEGARLLGFAQAQRALVSGNDAIYVNPAGMSHGRAYSLEMGFIDGLQDNLRRYNVSIMDSQAGPVAGGISYSFLQDLVANTAQGENRRSGHRLDVALSTKLGDELSLGVTARYMNYSETLGDEDVKDGGFDLFTLDTGLQYRHPNGFGAALVAYNLTKSDRPDVPIGWGGGLGYQSEVFSIEADIRYNAQIGKARYASGIGVVLGEMFPLRAGVAYDLKNSETTISAGIGFLHRVVGLDIGYRERVHIEQGRELETPKRLLAFAGRLLFF